MRSLRWLHISCASRFSVWKVWPIRRETSKFIKMVHFFLPYKRHYIVDAMQLYVIDGRQTVIRRVSRRVEQLSSWTYMTNEQKTFYYAECYLSVCTMQSRRKPEWGPQYPGEAHLERELWLSMGWINPRVRSRFFSFQWVGWVERAKSARLYFHENYIKSTKISSVAQHTDSSA